MPEIACMNHPQSGSLRVDHPFCGESLEEWHVKPGVAPEALCMLMGNFGIYSTIMNGAYQHTWALTSAAVSSHFSMAARRMPPMRRRQQQQQLLRHKRSKRKPQCSPERTRMGRDHTNDHLGFLILYPNSSQTPTFVTCLEPQVHTNPSISPLNSTN